MNLGHTALVGRDDNKRFDLAKVRMEAPRILRFDAVPLKTHA